METTAAEKIRTRKQELLITLPDTRGVQFNRWMRGNLKLGENIWSYSRLPGRPSPHGGTCPGATPECLSICYAFRIDGAVKDIYTENSATPEVPPLPEGAKFVRVHVSGDFDTPEYIASWVSLADANPDVRLWAYSRSWRVPELLPFLELLRDCKNFQLFASMDSSDDKLPPEGWRRAWLSNDDRSGYLQGIGHNHVTMDNQMTYLCPEETKRLPSCEACGYCFLGSRNDVSFVVH